MSFHFFSFLVNSLWATDAFHKILRYFILFLSRKLVHSLHRHFATSKIHSAWSLLFSFWKPEDHDFVWLCRVVQFVLRAFFLQYHLFQYFCQISFIAPWRRSGDLLAPTYRSNKDSNEGRLACNWCQKYWLVWNEETLLS